MRWVTDVGDVGTAGVPTAGLGCGGAKECWLLMTMRDSPGERCARLSTVEIVTSGEPVL